jgi:ribonuclease-3 family protein
MKSVSAEEARSLSPVTLAFLGDSVYETFIRHKIIEQNGTMPAGKLHRAAEALVRATFQSEAAEQLLPHLTPQEQDIYRRGRNAKTSRIPKSSSAAQYRRATALEAVLGYLYLCGQTDRIDSLCEVIYETQQKQTAENTDKP